jgi:hypothetical protein
MLSEIRQIRYSYIDCTAGRKKQKPSPPYAALCLTPIAPVIGARMVKRDDKGIELMAPNKALERNLRITPAPKKAGACVIRSSLSAALALKEEHD